MNKKKALIAVLSTLCVSALAFGLTACQPGDDSHEHVWGDVVVDTAPTIDTDGAGHHNCTHAGCTETEPVTLPKLGYQVTVYLPDGVTPFADLDVTIKEETVTTDANGYAKFVEFGAAGEYEITLDLGDYAEIYEYATVSTNATESEVQITLDGIQNGLLKETAFVIAGLSDDVITNEEEVSTSDSRYYKFTASESGNVVFENLSGGAFYVYNSDGDELVYVYGAKTSVVSVVAGADYYVKILCGPQDAGHYSFKVRAVTEDDNGTAAALAFEVTDTYTKTYTDASIFDRYFKIELDEVSLLSVKCGSDKAYSNIYVYVYSDESCSSQIGYFSLGTKANDTVSDVMSIVPGTYWVKASFYNYEGAQIEFELKVEESQLTDHTVTVKDSNDVAVAGVTVTVNGESQVTNADGVATFSIYPGKYTIDVDYDSSLYGYTAVSTKLGVTEYNVTLVNKAEYNFSVYLADGETPADGVEVSIYQFNGYGTFGYYSLVDSDTVGSDGTVTFNLLPDKTYYYVVTNVPNGYYEPEYPEDESVLVSGRNISVTLKQLVTYKITLQDEDGSALAGVVVSVNGVKGTTDADGVVSIDTVAGEYSIKISGYNTDTKTSADVFELTVTAAELTVDAFEGTYDLGTYMTAIEHTVDVTGTYKITINNWDGGYDAFYVDGEEGGAPFEQDEYVVLTVYLEAGQTFFIYGYNYDGTGDATYTVEKISDDNIV